MNVAVKEGLITFAAGGITAIALFGIFSAVGVGRIVPPGYPMHFVIGGASAIVGPLAALALTFTPNSPLG